MINKLTTPILTVILTFTALSCSGDKAVETGDANRANGDAQAYNLDGLKKEPVDASQLVVSNISVAKFIQNSETVGRLSFEVDGRADYVIYNACGSNEQCFNGRSALTRVVLPLLETGPVDIKVKACVDPGRNTTADECGPWNTPASQFVQPKPNDTEVKALLRQKADLNEQIKAYGTEMKMALERGQRKMDDCIKRNIEAVRLTQIKALTSAFLSMGESLLGQALATGDTCQGGVSLLLQQSGGVSGETAVADTAAKIFGMCQGVGAATQLTLTQTQQQVGQAISTGIKVKEVAGVVQKAATSLSTFGDYANLLEGAFSSVGMFGSSPVSAIQALGTSLFDLFTASKQVPTQCVAEQSMNAEVALIKAQVTQMKSRMAKIDEELGLGQ